MHAQFKISVPTSRKTQSDSNEKTNRFMFVRKIMLLVRITRNTYVLCGSKCEVFKCYSNNTKVGDLLTITNV